MFYNERLARVSGNIWLITTEFRHKDIVFKTMFPIIHVYKLALYSWLARTSQRIDQYISAGCRMILLFPPADERMLGAKHSRVPVPSKRKYYIVGVVEGGLPAS